MTIIIIAIIIVTIAIIITTKAEIQMPRLSCRGHCAGRDARRHRPEACSTPVYSGEVVVVWERH